MLVKDYLPRSDKCNYSDRLITFLQFITWAETYWTLHFHEHTQMSNFGQILKEVGEFGLFQKRLVAALCICSIFSAFNTIGQVYTAVSFQHHCNTDWILEHGPKLTDERQRNLTLPVNKDGRLESCKMFSPVDLDLEIIEAYGINSTTACIDGWDYKAPEGASSIVTEVSKHLRVPTKLLSPQGINHCSHP